MKFKTSLEPSLTLVDLTPLVDVIFLLLIFFIIASDILPLKSLNIENPELSLATSPRTSQILVVMDKDNVLYVGSRKEIVDFASFDTSLRREVEKNAKLFPGSETTVVLSVDREVAYEDFLRLFSLTQKMNTRIRLVYKDSSPTGHL